MRLGRAYKIIPSHDGKQIAVCGSGSRVAVWDLAEDRKIWEQPTLRNVSNLTWSGDQSCLVVKDTAGVMAVYSASDGALLRRLVGAPRVAEGYEMLAWGDDHLLSLPWGGPLTLWRLSDGAVLANAASLGGRMYRLLAVRGDEVLVHVTGPVPGAERAHVVEAWQLPFGDGPRRTVHLAAQMQHVWLQVVPGSESVWSSELLLGSSLQELDGTHGGELARLDLAGVRWQRVTVSPDARWVACVARDRVAVLRSSDGFVQVDRPWPGAENLTWHPDSERLWVASDSASGFLPLSGVKEVPPAPSLDGVSTVAQLLDLDQQVGLDDGVLDEHLRSLLYDSSYDAGACAALSPIIRAVAVTQHLGHFIDWDGLDGTLGNFPAHAPLAAEAYAALGLSDAAAIWADLAAKLATGKAIAQRTLEAREQKLNLATADDLAARVALVRRHPEVFRAWGEPTETRAG